MKTGANNLLHLIDLFADLDVEATNAIGEKCRWQRVSAGQTVLDQSEDSNDVYFVTEGALAATFFSTKGKEVGYLQLGRGDTFGEFAAIDGSARSASVVSLQESMVAAMKAAEFIDLIERHPSVGLRLCKLLVAKNRALTQRILEFSTSSVPNRVAAEIYRMADKVADGTSSPVIENLPTHYQIASRIASSREAVSRAISELARKGIVEHQAHRLTVLNMGLLRVAAGMEDT